MVLVGKIILPGTSKIINYFIFRIQLVQKIELLNLQSVFQVFGLKTVSRDQSTPKLAKKNTIFTDPSFKFHIFSFIRFSFINLFFYVVSFSMYLSLLLDSYRKLFKGVMDKSNGDMVLQNE